MLAWLFHEWERRIHAATPDRVVRTFEWGLDWIPTRSLHPTDAEEEVLERYVADALADSDTFFAAPRTRAYTLGADGHLTFPSALETPHPENNTVHARFFPARQSARWTEGRPRRAVVVLPQWNSDPGAHVGLCRLLSWFGLNALRLSLPYHDERMPPELTRADYIVSSNVARTLQSCRQAVLDARRCVDWLEDQGFERIGILGTSLGSCLSMLTAAHEPRIRAAALNHISTYFADVVWEGLSTSHVREGLDGHIDLERLRRLWLPISPRAHVDRMANTPTLLVYARYDLSFPLHLSRQLVDLWRERNMPHEVAVLPCGHYTTGKSPFKWIDGYYLTKFLLRYL